MSDTQWDGTAGPEGLHENDAGAVRGLAARPGYTGGDGAAPGEGDDA